MVYIDICGYIHSQICTCMYSKGRFLKINSKLKFHPQEIYMYFKRNKIWREDEKVEKREGEMLM